LEKPTNLDWVAMDPSTPAIQEGVSLENVTIQHTYNSMPLSCVHQAFRVKERAHNTRLIDEGTLGLEASVSGQAERYGRGKTSHTIHVWWARRPHGAMRALVFATLMPNGRKEEETVMRELAFAFSPDAQVVKDAKRLLKSQYHRAPKVLDVFGGGGTIPYEAALLGAEATSLDYNPLSVFIQKSNLEFAQEALKHLPLNEIVKAVRESGTRVLSRLRERTRDLFPLRESQGGKGVFAYFWSYRLRCNACGYDFLLMKRPWLSRKAGKRTVLAILDSGPRQSVTIRQAADDDETISVNSAWPGRNGTACCPRCRKEYKNPSIQVCSDALVAIGELARNGGKAFFYPPDNAIPSVEYLEAREARVLTAGDLYLPKSRLPRWSGIVNPALYGIETHSDFLNQRQRVVLLELIRGLKEEHERLQDDYPPEVARYVLSALSALIDQIVDWNCRLSMWISQNEQVGRAFCGPGVPMLWDYVETDPLLRGPANLWDKLERIAAGVGATPCFEERPRVWQGRAQSLPFPAGTFDAVVTDPPYYDNVFYNVLADFFYAWKRPLLENLCPELFGGDHCEEEAELVASQFRQGDHASAHKWYCKQLTECLQEVKRVLTPDGALSFLFSHSSLWGWEAIVQSFRRSGLVLTSAGPLSVERRQRPRAMTSEAVNTCIVLVGRKAPLGPPIDIGRIEEGLGVYARTVAPLLEDCGWHSEDIGMAIFAQGVVAAANACCVAGVESDEKALQRLGHVVRMLAPGFKLRSRQSL
jgi:putative DNA methylase